MALDWLSSGELNNLMVASIDYHERNKVWEQAIYDKHLLRDLEATEKSFPGGLDLITWTARGDYPMTEEGFAGDQVVTFQNPSELKRASIPYFNLHIGLSVSFDELKRNGLTVVNTTSGLERTRDQANSASTRINNILTDKIEVMTESKARERSRMWWGDGSADPKKPAGVRYWIQDDPTAPVVVGNLDQGAISWWRNRAKLGINASQGNASSNNLIDTLQVEYRQLTRFGGRPNKAYCGSDFLTQLERELRARGSYTEAGWSGRGGINVAMDGVNFKGTEFVYEPELDEEGMSKRLYWLQIGNGGLCIRYMDGEKNRKHTPARPENRFAGYCSITDTCALQCYRRNGSGVYSIA